MNAPSEQRARQREFGADRVETLLNSSTLDQMRSALARLKDGRPPTVRTRDEAELAIQGCGRTNVEIEQALLDIEAQTPTRHCVLTRFSGDIEPDKLLSSSLPLTISRLAFKAVYQRSTEKYVSITFEHAVEVQEWRLVDGDNKRREIHQLRHPILLRLHKNSQIALFCFPGFSQGAAQKRQDRLQYSEIINQLIGVLTQRAALTFSPIPIEKCVSALQSGESSRVRIVRSDFEAAEGRVSLASPAQKKSVEELLTDVISPYLQVASRPQLLAAIIEAVKDANTNSVVAYWLDEKVITRIRSWKAGAEFLFIWHNTTSSFGVINRIMELLVTLADQLIQSPTLDLWNVITALQKGDRVNLWKLGEKTGQSRNFVKDGVLAAVRAGILRPVYRLKTNELILDYANDWTAEAGILNGRFTTESGVVIDGGDPEQIDVAFERVVMEQAQ